MTKTNKTDQKKKKQPMKIFCVIRKMKHKCESVETD